MPDQIVWLGNFRNKLPNSQAPLGYAAGDLTAIQADCDRQAWLIETFQEAAQSFAQSVTAHIRLIQNGTGNALVAPPWVSGRNKIRATEIVFGLKTGRGKAAKLVPTIGARRRSPEGTTEADGRAVSFFPAGTRLGLGADPALKCWAIFFRPLGWGREPERARTRVRSVVANVCAGLHQPNPGGVVRE